MKEPIVKRGLAAVAVVLMVMAAASLANGSAWATPTQDVLRQTIPTPEPSPGVTPEPSPEPSPEATPEPTPGPPPQSIVLPPQPGGNDYSFVYVPLPPVNEPPPVGCEIYNPFRVEAYLGTELVYPKTFDPPLQICVSYTDDQAAEVGGPENLSVVYWDAELQQWIPLDNRRHDADLSQICGDISFLSANNIFAITCVISPTAVPVTGHSTGNASPYAVLLLVAALTGIAAVGLKHQQARKRG